MADLDPSEYTIDELENELETIDDSTTLREAFEIEAESDDRKGAKEAIEQQLQEIENNTGSDDGEQDGSIGILEIRNHVQDNATELLGREIDGITTIQSNDEGWTAVIEAIERRSIPDTQDILGRYEIQLDGEGTIRGYHRLERYRRSDTASTE